METDEGPELCAIQGIQHCIRHPTFHNDPNRHIAIDCLIDCHKMYEKHSAPFVVEFVKCFGGPVFKKIINLDFAGSS